MHSRHNPIYPLETHPKGNDNKDQTRIYRLLFFQTSS